VSGGSWSGALRLAVGTLTVLPVRASAPTAVVAGRAMAMAPLAVAPLAAVSAAASWGAHALGWPALLVGLAGVGVLALGTRALHLDGLADTVDALGSGWDRERALAIMRAGDIGPMGVVALILVLGAQVVAIGELVSSAVTAVLLLVIICASRAAVCLACMHGMPAARAEGLGAAVAGSVPRPVVAISWLLISVLLTGLGWVVGGRWWLLSVAVGLALLIVALLLRHCVRRFGGITGDVIGAAVEVNCTVLLLGAMSA
jgi:adenosylcobinamide-GDP ribazoletransferase